MMERLAMAADIRPTAVLADGSTYSSRRLTQVLEQFGYHVREISDPLHALIAIESDMSVELVVTGSRLNGLSMAQAAHEIRRSVSVITLAEDRLQPMALADALTAKHRDSAISGITKKAA
jgi:PleD family two-component response regulator